MKGFVIALTAVAVAAVLILLYGGLRPEGDIDGAVERLEGGIGDLVPRRTLTLEDIDAACVDPDSGELVVAAADVCRFSVPDSSSLLLCADASTPVAVSTDGQEYPVQRVPAADVTCGTEETIPIYDRSTVVAVECLIPAASAVVCRVEVRQPD